MCDGVRTVGWDCIDTYLISYLICIEYNRIMFLNPKLNPDEYERESDQSHFSYVKFGCYGCCIPAWVKGDYGILLRSSV
jgi:hypothetical protein